ncbi:MAG TPA: hypothetical protein DEP41_09265 [Rhodobacter sp.]|nr:hypothetical protein [Rhodobacter sp.]
MPLPWFSAVSAKAASAPATVATTATGTVVAIFKKSRRFDFFSPDELVIQKSFLMRTSRGLVFAAWTAGRYGAMRPLIF